MTPTTTPLMRTLAHAVDESLVTAQQLKLETVEQLLAMASLELSMRMEMMEAMANQPLQRAS